MNRRAIAVLAAGHFLTDLCQGLVPVSILLTGAGLALGAQATTFALALLAFALSGLGVAAYHPEAARQAYLASGDRRATGMSWFTVGGRGRVRLSPDADDRSGCRVGDQGSPGPSAADWTCRHAPGSTHQWNGQIAGQSSTRTTYEQRAG